MLNVAVCVFKGKKKRLTVKLLFVLIDKYFTERGALLKINITVSQRRKTDLNTGGKHMDHKLLSSL